MRTILALLALSAPALAQTQTVTIDLTSQLPHFVRPITPEGGAPTDLNYRLKVPRFDPALGTLVRAEFQYTFDLWTSWQMENLSASQLGPMLVTTGVTNYFAMEPVRGPVANARNILGLGGQSAEESMGLLRAGFDGLLDFSGPSGGASYGGCCPQTHTVRLTPIERARFVGTGRQTAYFHPVGYERFEQHPDTWGVWLQELNIGRNDRLLMVYSYL